MPSADDFVPHFDNFDDQPVAAAPPPAADSDDPWGFNNNPPPPVPRSKKKKKKEKNARQTRADDGEDSSAYPKSITPSPPADHSVKPRAASPPPALPAQSAAAPSPLVDTIDDDADDNTIAVEHVEPLPAPRPSKPSPAISPIVRSPRAAVARPVLPAASPPSHPISLHGRDRQSSLSAYRPTAPTPQSSQPRRESFVSPRPRFTDPPPPHMPQAHFFGLPDLGLKFNQKPEAGKPAGSNGYCCKLDSLADAGDATSAKKARDALLVGCEGGLEVFRILPNKLEVVGRLEGLRGAVIGAKVLPHTDKFDHLQVLRPLVAVITHGPMLEDRTDSGKDVDDGELDGNDTASHFQTTVDVYSLQTQHYIATLYRSTPVLIEQPVVGQVSSLPDPVGDLQLDAQGQFITVSSGKSGEVFVFTQAPYSGVEETQFRCIGKFWTTIQTPMSAPPSRSPSAGDIVVAPEVNEEPRRPIYTLSKRWLAIVPPFLSSSISIQGAPLLSNINPTPPGITTHAAPPQPLVSCEVVGTDVEGAWSRLGRQAAQGLVKYSQRGIEMGLQGWKELTHPSPPNGGRSHDRSSSKDDLFPPTKAPMDDPSRLAKEPALVSVVDLESLLFWEEHKPKYVLPPMSTFALVEGCNFLSLSSTGTRLVTASRKGEVSTLWDLTQVAHGIPKRGVDQDEDTSTSPCIKQLQRIARNSPSTVLECAWSKDDDALAVLTAHGTIHLHEVPLRPISRKRKRVNAAAAYAGEKADATVGLSTATSPPSANQGFLGSIKVGWQTMSTQVNSIRTTNPASALGLPTTFAGFRDATAAASNAGSRAVARGLSQGYTAAKGGASDYWHADDNKIRHTKALQEPFSAKSLRWIRRNNTTSVAIACGGSVHIHPVQRAIRQKGDAIVSGLRHEKYARKAFPLPPITVKAEAGGLQGLLADTCTGEGPHGFWSLRHSSPPPMNERRTSLQPAKLLQGQANDVETNPPYCPFHVDSRVSILAFEERDNNSQYETSLAYDEFQIRGHGFQDEEAWAFGETLPPAAKLNEHMPDELHDSELFHEDEDDDDEDVASQMESRLTIQPARNTSQGGIRINTRRRQGKIKGKPGGSGSGGADGDFELLEDDDSIF